MIDAYFAEKQNEYKRTVFFTPFFSFVFGRFLPAFAPLLAFVQNA